MCGGSLLIILRKSTVICEQCIFSKRLCFDLHVNFYIVIYRKIIVYAVLSTAWHCWLPRIIFIHHLMFVRWENRTWKFVVFSIKAQCNESLVMILTIFPFQLINQLDSGYYNYKNYNILIVKNMYIELFVVLFIMQFELEWAFLENDEEVNQIIKCF